MEISLFFSLSLLFQFRECLFLEADLPHVRDAAKVK